MRILPIETIRVLTIIVRHKIAIINMNNKVNTINDSKN